MLHGRAAALDHVVEHGAIGWRLGLVRIVYLPGGARRGSRSRITKQHSGGRGSHYFDFRATIIVPHTTN